MGNYSEGGGGGGPDWGMMGNYREGGPHRGMMGNYQETEKRASA